MATLLCPLCSQSRFDNLDALRGRLVRAATQNIKCPICGELLLGLDKFTIHLFGHSLPAPEHPEVTKTLATPDPPTPPPPPPCTVNMDDLSFLTSWETCWKQTQEPPKHKEEQEHTKSKSDDPLRDLFVEVTPKAEIRDSFVLPADEGGPNFSGNLSQPEKLSTFPLKTTEIPNTKNYQHSAGHPVLMDSILLHQQPSMVNFINPRLIHNPSDQNSNTVCENYATKTPHCNEPRHPHSPNTNSPPAFIFDRDESLILTPSPKAEECDSLEGREGKQSGEVRELSQYMAGLLRIEGVAQPTVEEKPQQVEGLNRMMQQKSGDLSLYLRRILLQEWQEKEKQQQGLNQPELTVCIQGLKQREQQQPELEDNKRQEQLVLKQEHDSQGPLTFMAELLQKKRAVQQRPNVEESPVQEAFACRECGKCFRMRGSLVVHTRVAHAGRGLDVLPEPRNFRCTLCSKAFKKEQHLSQHMKTHDGKQWQCETCSKFFTTKYFLKKHQRLHTGEMPYCCETCGKTFTFQQSYHKHLLYHSADKPHECRECGRSFKELSTLHNHQRIHSGEKPFACETCGKCFRQRVSYIVHQRIHTGVLPYQCTACSKKFRYKVSQRSHKCTAHPPGIVVRQPGDLIQRLLEQRRLLQIQQ